MIVGVGAVGWGVVVAGRSGRVWAAPAVAFVLALVLAVFTVMANVATTTVTVANTPGWLHNPWVLWPVVAVLAVLTGLLGWRAARLRQSTGDAPGELPGQSVSDSVIGRDNIQISRAGGDVNIGRRRGQKG